MVLLSLSIIASMMIIPVSNTFAQNLDVQGIEFDTNTGLTIVLIGVSAGVLVAYQGYRTTKENWDTLKFLDGLIYSVLGSVPLAIGSAITQTHLGIFEYVMIFGASMGFGWQMRKSREPTVASNQG